MKPNPQVKTLLNRALHYLKYRLRSEHEMRRYLATKYPSASKELINAVIGQLVELSFIDDLRFTQEWIRSRLNRGKGEHLYRRELNNMGVAEGIIDQVCQEVTTKTPVQKAKELIIKKERHFNKLNKFQRSQKIKQYLFHRGFSSQTIRAVIDDLPSDELK